MMEFGAFRRAWRSLRRSPGFLAVSVLSLGVALGLTVATFAMVNGALYQKVLFAHPERLFFTNLRYGNQHQMPSPGEQQRSLRALPAVQDVGVTSSNRVFLNAGGRPNSYIIAHATPNLFTMEGVRLRMGRYPTSAEMVVGRAVIMSSRLWTDMFANRPKIDDATITLSGRIYSIVGVWPQGDAGPVGADVTIPFASAGDVDRLKYGGVIVQLRAGVDSLAVKAQLATLAAGFTAEYVAPTSASPPYLLQLDTMVPQPPKLRDNLFELLLTAIGFGVLLIGCTNVTALALARGLTRKRDYALRIALGASRASIAGDVLNEIVVIAVLGTIVGAAVALAVVGILTHMVPEDLARWGMYIPDLSGRVFIWSALALAGGMLVAGGVPAWRASRVSPADPLKDNAGTTTGRTRNEFRFLVISELAVAMVLLMLTSLVTLSTRNILNFDYGFNISPLVNVNSFDLSRAGDSSMRAMQQKQERIVQRLRGMPGVAAASIQGSGDFPGRFLATDDRGDMQLPRAMSYQVTGPGYFVTSGIPLVSGRDIAGGDATGNGAVVLSQTAARRFFPHENPVGHMLKIDDVKSDMPWLPVIGVAKDVAFGPSDDPDTFLKVYVQLPPSAFPDSAGRPWLFGLGVLARVPHPDAARTRALQFGIRDLVPANNVPTVTAWTSYQASRARQNEFFGRLLSMLSFSALVLGSIGLFSVLSYSVGQRMREFAVRQALGATPRNIVRVVLTGAFEMAIGGTAVGALLSFWASSGISSLLFGVKNTDPMSLVIAEATLMAVALAAALVPAFRAMRADPVEILRSS